MITVVVANGSIYSGIVAISFDVFESFESLRKCNTYKFDRRRVTTDLNY